MLSRGKSLSRLPRCLRVSSRESAARVVDSVVAGNVAGDVAGDVADDVAGDGVGDDLEDMNAAGDMRDVEEEV